MNRSNPSKLGWTQRQNSADVIGRESRSKIAELALTSLEPHTMLVWIA